MPALVRPSRGHTTQPFGNTQPDGQPHAGEDYAYWNPATGETFPEIFAAAGGVVLFSGDSRGLSWPNIMYLNNDFNRADTVDSSAGVYTIIRHPDGQLTGYGHQAETFVTAGQTVVAGQVIGICGDTGNTRGKHLHFDYVPDPGQVHVAPYYGRARPVYGALTQHGSTTPAPTKPKEWDEMATKAEIHEAVWGGPGTPLIHNYRLKRGEYPKTILGALEGRIQNEILAPLRADIAAMSAVQTGLVGALKAVTGGEQFDEAKLLEGVQAAAKAGAEQGVKNAIDSIGTTVTISS